MLEAFTEAERNFLTRIIGTKILPHLHALARSGTAYAFQQWNLVCEEQRQKERAIAMEKEVRRIMRESQRGNRTVSEKDTLNQYVSKLACIPSEVSPTAMEILCNEIDYFPCLGKSIMFLQGDFGSVYYIIARGQVALYLEKSKDREMQIGTEFGKWRGVPYTEDLSTLNRLGFNIATLKEGQGFGEFAILSTTGKLRMCAAVAITDDTLIFVLHGDTYNAVLRQHHYRSKQLSQATALLKQLPLFNTFSFSKLSQIAYGMKSSSFTNTSVLVKGGAAIKTVLLVNSGQVKVLRPLAKRKEPSNADGVYNAQETLEMRLPKLALAIMGRGCIIGQHELYNGLETFQNTYICCSPVCEVFEMPTNIFRECCLSAEAQALAEARALRTVLDARAVDYSDRVQRTEESTKKFAMAHAKSIDDKAQLLRLLPLLIDGINLDPVDASGSNPASGKKTGTYNKYSKDTTAADIVKESSLKAGTGWAHKDFAPYGYDPSVSELDNLSITAEGFQDDRKKQLHTVNSAATARPPSSPQIPKSPRAPPSASPSSPRTAMTGIIHTPGKKSHLLMASPLMTSRMRALAPSPHASDVLPASVISSFSAPASPRV